MNVDAKARDTSMAAPSAKVDAAARGSVVVDWHRRTAEVKDAPAQLEGKTDLDAVIAFLQSLGNQVKFEEGVNYRD